MSLNISSYNNVTGSKVNTQSKQYKAMEEKGWISGVIQNESMMSPEEKMIYETFGGRDTIIKNLMKQFDSEGHNSNTDQPDEVNRLIEKFFSEVDGKGVSG